MHRQVMIRVNTPVDTGIAPLVEALTRFKDVVTLTSCEQDCKDQAYVAFAIENADLPAHAAFLQSISEKVRDHGGDIPVSLSLEWFGGSETPIAWVRIPHYQVGRLAELFDSITDNRQ